MSEQRPLCECHGEPMHRNGGRGTSRGYYVCAVRNRAKAASRRAQLGPELLRSYHRAYYEANWERWNDKRAQSRLTPLDHLWFATADVLDYLRRQLGSDMETELAAAGLTGTVEGLKRRAHCRLGVADELCVRLGLHVDNIGEPIVSSGPPSNPQRKAAA